MLVAQADMESLREGNDVYGPPSVEREIFMYALWNMWHKKSSELMVLIKLGTITLSLTLVTWEGLH